MPKHRTSKPRKLINLVVPQEEAHRKLTEQLEAGAAILEWPIDSRDDLVTALSERAKWISYTKELLLRLFDEDDLATEFAYPMGGRISPTPSQKHAEFLKHQKRSLVRLQSILDRLELIPTQATDHPPSTATASITDVFVVHGHDEGARETVARFVTQLGLNPIILHEQPNKGRTVIEKFEGHAGVAFAVVLLTADDVGASSANRNDLRRRARQNVVLELGFFCGSLGRARVCALRKGDVEIPSDYLGVLYIDLDDKGAWRMALAKEMKVAGLPVDLNKAL